MEDLGIDLSLNRRFTQIPKIMPLVVMYLVLNQFVSVEEQQELSYAERKFRNN